MPPKIDPFNVLPSMSDLKLMGTLSSSIAPIAIVTPLP